MVMLAPMELQDMVMLAPMDVYTLAAMDQTEVVTLAAMEQMKTVKLKLNVSVAFGGHCCDCFANELAALLWRVLQCHTVVVAVQPCLP